MSNVLDLDFMGIPRAIAAFELAGCALIECGPASTIPRLLQELERVGTRPEDIRHVLVTHIHLDHAGAAGWWAQRGARIYVHEQGAAHLVDPSKLLASAGRIYGDMMDTLWGETLPVPPDRIVPLKGGEELEIGLVTVRPVDTPGHARHHLAYQVEEVVFAGDVAAVRIDSGSFVSLPAPPPEFDPEQWSASLRRLRELEAERLYLTHFGAVDAVNDHLDRVQRLLVDCVAFIEEHHQLPREELVARYVAWTRERAVGEESEWEACEKANPLPMSVDGILRYLKKRAVTR